MSPAARLMDTGYWLALIDERDQHHRRAVSLARDLAGPFITTEAILVEVGNTFAAVRWRSRGVDLLNRILTDPTIEIVPVTSDLLRRAIDLYTGRSDKDWGLTDCVSFVVMRDRGITEALAADHHVIQAGFRALLREP